MSKQLIIKKASTSNVLIGTCFAVAATFCQNTVAASALEELTFEQNEVLNASQMNGFHSPADSADRLSADNIKLLSIKVSAEANAFNNNSFDFVASYRGVGLNLPVNTFSVKAPQLSSFDFSEAIKNKMQETPFVMLEKAIVDGALGFQLDW